MKNKNLVVSVDNFIYGIHCPKYINISSGVNRAILVAISDLSAMAAKPYCIFISITLNRDNISIKLLTPIVSPNCFFVYLVKYWTSL